MGELDPIGDEGLVFSRKLEEAGVKVRSRIIKGKVHASECIFTLDIPEIHNAAIKDIKTFLKI